MRYIYGITYYYWNNYSDYYGYISYKISYRKSYKQ